jgi:hypothetical protein
MISSIFPTLIGEYQLDIDNMSLRTQLSTATRWQENWHTGEFGDQALEVKKLYDLMLKYSQEVATAACGVDIAALDVWTNDLIYGEPVGIHGHGSSIVSAVYYIEVPKDCYSDLILVDPRGSCSWNFYNIEHTRHGRHNNGQTGYRIAPKEGNLVIIPGWLQHYVEPNLSQDRRFAVVSNYIDKSFYSLISSNGELNRNYSPNAPGL